MVHRIFKLEAAHLVIKCLEGGVYESADHVPYKMWFRRRSPRWKRLERPAERVFEAVGGIVCEVERMHRCLYSRFVLIADKRLPLLSSSGQNHENLLHAM